MSDQHDHAVHHRVSATALTVFTDLDRLFEQILRQDDACMPIAVAELLARIATEERSLEDVA